MENTKGKSEVDRKTVAIIWYFITRLNGVLGKTHLQKIMFLTDLLSSKKFQEPLTVMKYKRYHYGPYTQDLGDYTDYLVKKGLIEERKFPLRSDSSKLYSRFYATKPFIDKELLIKEVGSSDKVLLLEEVISSYGNLSLQEVLDIVYGLQEMENTDFNDPLNLAKEIGAVEKDQEEAPF